MVNEYSESHKERTKMSSKEVVKKDSNVITINSPFDIDPDVFKAGLDRRETNRQALLKWISSNLKEDVDYGTIKNKPSLWKAGAEKIRGMLGVKVSYPGAEKYIESASQGIEISQVFVKCVITNADHVPLSEGMGARTLRQDKGDINKCVKMAEKSSSIDATLNLGGLSEIFTQDLEDMFKDEEKEKKVPSNKIEFEEPDNPTKHIEEYVNSITDIGLQSQAKEMITKCKTKDDLKKEWLKYKDWHSEGIFPEDAFDIITELKNMLKGVL